jgi:hypothetical protein
MSSTLTTNLQLFKPTPGTGEKFRPSDVNDNSDKIDAAIGAPYVDVSQGTAGNTTTETSVFSNSIGPGIQGSTWKFEVFGQYAHSASATTLTIRVKIGGSTVSFITINTPASALSGKPWGIDGTVMILTTGGSGTFRYFGKGFATVNVTDTLFLMQGSTTKDTTTSQALSVTMQWGAANVANVATLDGGFIRRVTNA